MAFFNKASKKEKEKEVQVPRVASGEGKIGVSRDQKDVVGILLRPHVTEKTAAVAQTRTYVFAVGDDANKAQIKKAVESRYGVSVTNVRVLNTDGKQVRRGRQIGWRKGVKKAYATIAEGQQIEVQ